MPLDYSKWDNIDVSDEEEEKQPHPWNDLSVNQRDELVEGNRDENMLKQYMNADGSTNMEGLRAALKERDERESAAYKGAVDAKGSGDKPKAVGDVSATAFSGTLKTTYSYLYRKLDRPNLEPEGCTAHWGFSFNGQVVSIKDKGCEETPKEEFEWTVSGTGEGARDVVAAVLNLPCPREHVS